MEKFNNKYRIPSARARFWDYAWDASYFITICTQNRECWFGNVVNGKMNLSPFGHIANSCWYEIPNHFPFVELGTHIIMPNHVHGIVTINKQEDVGGGVGGGGDGGDGGGDGGGVGGGGGGGGRDARYCVSTGQTGQTGQTGINNETYNQFAPQSRNLASIIRGFKIGVTTNARQVSSNFAWQSRYHDRIIRDENEYWRISQYIINNPQKWEEDEHYQ